MDTLRVSEIFSDATRMLIAIESVNFQHGRSDAGCQLYGSVKPIAIIVCNPDGAYALDMEAETADLDQLRRDLPELDTIFARFAHV